MAKFTASIQINATSNLGKVGKDVDKSFNKMSKSASKTSFRLQGLSADMSRLTRRMGQLAVVGFGAAILKGAQFETALQDLSALTGLVGGELKFAGDEAKTLGEKYGVSAKNVVGAIKKIGSARSELLKDPNALLEISEQALILSKAARIDLSTAVEAVTTSMNQFGLETADAGRVINVLAAGSKVGASEIAQTATAIARAGVAMKIAGVSFEDGNAAIQVLAKNGIDAERAGTALKTALLKLTSKGIDAISPKVVGLDKALENLAGANLDAAALTELFGLEAIAAGKILIDNRKLLRDWSKEMTGTQTATSQAGTNMDTFAEKMKRLGAIVENDFIGVFENSESTLSALVDQMIIDFEKFEPIKTIFQGIADAIELVVRGTQTLAGGLGGIVGRVDSAPTVLGKIDAATGFSAFADAVKSAVTIDLNVNGAATVERTSGDADVNISTSMGIMTPAL
jgi:TP901 family phage tail tape measure protein